MRKGYFGARADSRGLAHQALGYCQHLDFDRIYGLDLTADNLSPYPTDWRPYESLPSDLYINRHSQLDESDIRHFLRGLDIVMGAETFYKDEVITIAREEGVRTILVANPEFSPWGQPRDHSPRPDVVLVPTPWRMDDMQQPVYHLPFPVDRNQFPFRLRTTADHFVHIAGHKAMGDRAGTRIVIPTLHRFPGRLTIRSQSPLGYSAPNLKPHLQERNVGSPQDLYDDADVIIHPRRYGGNSLVIQEALSSGCPVITLNRDPENTWPGVVTIPSRARQSMRTKAGVMRIHDGSPLHLLRAMNDLVNFPGRMEELSLAADAYAERISWDTLLPVYEGMFKAVMDERTDSYLRGFDDAFRSAPYPNLPVAP